MSSLRSDKSDSSPPTRGEVFSDVFINIKIGHVRFVDNHQPTGEDILRVEEHINSFAEEHNAKAYNYNKRTQEDK